MEIEGRTSWDNQSERRREAWICKCNITHFARILDVAVDGIHRVTVLELIAEQQAKLADIHRAYRSRSVAERRARN